MRIEPATITQYSSSARALQRLVMPCLLALLAAACSSAPTLQDSRNTAAALGSACELPGPESLASVVRVYAENGEHSSGVVIAPDLIVTVSHGLPESGRVFVGIDEQLKVATLLARHPGEDLAVLQAVTGSTPIMPLGNDHPDHNALVWAVGYPLGMEQRASLGLYQGGTESLVYSSAHINSGASGGALLACEANRAEGMAPRYTLAGVLKGFLAQPTVDDVVNTGDSVAVSTQRIRELLEQATPQVAHNH